MSRLAPREDTKLYETSEEQRRQDAERVNNLMTRYPVGCALALLAVGLALLAPVVLPLRGRYPTNLVLDFCTLKSES